MHLSTLNPFILLSLGAVLTASPLPQGSAAKENNDVAPQLPPPPFWEGSSMGEGSGGKKPPAEPFSIPNTQTAPPPLVRTSAEPPLETDDVMATYISPPKGKTTTSIIDLPTTIIPTSAISTDIPTTNVPPGVPVSIAPTDIPTTIVPPGVPVSIAPTDIPTTIAPPSLPVSIAPIDLPTTDVPIDLPTTDVPIDLPTTNVPTDLPTTDVPIDLPTIVGSRIPTLPLGTDEVSPPPVQTLLPGTNEANVLPAPTLLPGTNGESVLPAPTLLPGLLPGTNGASLLPVPTLLPKLLPGLLQGTDEANPPSVPTIVESGIPTALPGMNDVMAASTSPSEEMMALETSLELVPTMLNTRYQPVAISSTSLWLSLPPSTTSKDIAHTFTVVAPTSIIESPASNIPTTFETQMKSSEINTRTETGGQGQQTQMA